jgi:beta-glucanase (GH16 family)
MFMVLNVAIGGNWAGPQNSTTPFPAKMEVDYVRVWEKIP